MKIDATNSPNFTPKSVVLCDFYLKICDFFQFSGKKRHEKACFLKGKDKSQFVGEKF